MRVTFQVLSCSVHSAGTLQPPSPGWSQQLNSEFLHLLPGAGGEWRGLTTDFPPDPGLSNSCRGCPRPPAPRQCHQGSLGAGVQTSGVWSAPPCLVALLKTPSPSDPSSGAGAARLQKHPGVLLDPLGSFFQVHMFHRSICTLPRFSGGYRGTLSLSGEEEGAGVSRTSSEDGCVCECVYESDSAGRDESSPSFTSTQAGKNPNFESPSVFL